MVDKDKVLLTPGPGVDTGYFSPEQCKDDQTNRDNFIFLLIARMLWDKGIGEFAKGGFGWIVPVGGGMAKVGLISKANPKICFKNIMERYFPEEKDMSLQIKPIAQGIVSKTFSDRALAVGEAAGQVKTTTGGNIYFELLCAEIAVDVIKDAFEDGDFSERRLSAYEKQWKSKIGSEIRLGAVARNLYGRLKDSHIEKIFDTVQSDGFFDYVARHADFDRHGSFVLSFLKMLYSFD